MSASVKIAAWVQKKPLILMRCDEEFVESLRSSKQGFERFTIVRPHSVFENYKLPTPCLLEIEDHGGTQCYLATATLKASVSTFDSRLTIKKIRPIGPSSFNELASGVTDGKMMQLLIDRLPEKSFSYLSPKLSGYLIEMLGKDTENHPALETTLSLLPQLRRTPNGNWAQENAIQTAMAVFDIRGNIIPEQVVLKRGTSSGLGLIGTYLYEDNVVHADASQMPGFEAIAPNVTGRATFQKRDERLTIYTANKLPLEKMLGVDLIYINETRGNAVMIQYKMLEEAKQDGSNDWLYRPDKQLRDEIARMKLPTVVHALSGYRLSSNPFFFKFVKRKIVDDSHRSFLVTLDHLNQILAAPETKGPKGGIRLSYKTLNGTYLREADMLGLIRSGYIGTHREETEALATIIDEVAKGNKALVMAWQQTIEEGN